MSKPQASKKCRKHENKLNALPRNGMRPKRCKICKLYYWPHKRVDREIN